MSDMIDFLSFAVVFPPVPGDNSSNDSDRTRLRHPAPAERWQLDRGDRSGAPLRGLGPHHLSRCRDAERDRRAGLCRARRERRLPAARRLLLPPRSVQPPPAPPPPPPPSPPPPPHV